MINPNCYETTTRGNAPLVSPSPACGEHPTFRFRPSPRRAPPAQDPSSHRGSRTCAGYAELRNRTAPVGQDLHPKRAEYLVWGCRGLGFRRSRAGCAFFDLSETLAEAPVVRTAEESACFSVKNGEKGRTVGRSPTRWPSLMPLGTSGVGASRPLLKNGCLIRRSRVIDAWQS
jgi:hypothetical protein